MAKKKSKPINDFFMDPYVVATLLAGLVFASRVLLSLFSDAIVVPYAANPAQVALARELIYIIHDTVMIMLGLIISIKAVLSRKDPVIHTASFVAVAIAFLSAWDLVDMFGRLVFFT